MEDSLIDEPEPNAELLCYRFFNCQLWFNQHELITLLNVLTRSGVMEREIYFKTVLSCRRRYIGSLAGSPVEKMFSHKDAMLCYTVLYCATLCYVMLCYAMLCYAMLCHDAMLTSTTVRLLFY